MIFFFLNNAHELEHNDWCPFPLSICDKSSLSWFLASLKLWGKEHHVKLLLPQWPFLFPMILYGIISKSFDRINCLSQSRFSWECLLLCRWFCREELLQAASFNSMDVRGCHFQDTETNDKVTFSKTSWPTCGYESPIPHLSLRHSIWYFYEIIFPWYISFYILTLLASIGNTHCMSYWHLQPTHFSGTFFLLSSYGQHICSWTVSF